MRRNGRCIEKRYISQTPKTGQTDPRMISNIACAAKKNANRQPIYAVFVFYDPCLSQIESE